MSDTVLQVDQLKASVSNGAFTCVADFTVRRGEVVAILGANGSGKSTLLRGIAGLLPIIGGRIQVGAVDVTSLPAVSRARLGIGLLAQGAQVFPSLTVREHLRLALGPDRKGTGLNAVITAAVEGLPALGPALDRTARWLSGGERQQLALATTILARRPMVALLDEPTAGLPIAMVQKVLRLTIDSVQSQGGCALIVEHRVDDVLDVADRVIVLSGGRTVLDRSERLQHPATHQEIRSHLTGSRN